MGSLITRAGFAAIAKGLRLKIPRKLQNFYQHARTLEEIRKRNINLVFDVGANRGFYSQHLRMGGYDGFIFSFEPVAESFRELEARAAADPKWRVFNCALGAEEGHIDFNVVSFGNELVLSSALQPKTFDFPTTKTRVPVRTFQEVLASTSPVPEPNIFLKMDTQGYDMQVFTGTGNCAAIKLLQSEVPFVPSYDGMTPYTDLLAAYHQAGFRMLDLFLVGRCGDYIAEMDALMVREEVSPAV